MQRTIIVGAGLSGLTCAKVVHAAGESALILEAEPSVGGRVRSLQQDGYTLDRGFQVLFTRYPQVRRHLDLARLAPCPFERGAIIMRSGRRTILANPLPHPRYLLPAVLSPAITPFDRLRLAWLVWEMTRTELAEVWAQPDQPAADFLRARGFSGRFLTNFARPFFGGIFLDRSLSVSTRALRVVIKMLAEGQTVVPAAGMGAITQQLAESFPRDWLRLSTRVIALLREEGRVIGVRTEVGEELRAEQVVVATEAPVAQTLTGLPTPTGQVSEINVQFASPVSLYPERLLVLNANRDAFINDAAQMTNVAPGYAPPGHHLLSCTITGDSPLSDAEIEARCRQELAGWFGAATAAALTLLRIWRLPYCQFAQPPGFNNQLPANQTAVPGLILAGDYTAYSSIDGAMRSGEQAAQLVLRSRVA